VVGMHKLSNLLFVSSNTHKFKEAKEILNSFGISIQFFKLNLVEIQSNSIREIAIKKAQDAFSKCKKPLIIEDDGLNIDSLDGFPGPYSSYVQKTIGNKGILNLLKKIEMQNLFQPLLIVIKIILNLLKENYMEVYLNLKKGMAGVLIQYLFQKIQRRHLQN
jgi:non-canonical purine NTP pyrophosphatase (RdgB/HAM1 family)